MSHRLSWDERNEGLLPGGVRGLASAPRGERVDAVFSSPWSNLSCQYISVSCAADARRAAPARMPATASASADTATTIQIAGHRRSAPSAQSVIGRQTLYSPLDGGSPQDRARRSTRMTTARERLSQHRFSRDYRVLRATLGRGGASALMERDDVDLVLADVELPGVERLRLAADRARELPARRIHHARRSARTSTPPVAAIKLGAYHFLAKDADPDVLPRARAHAVERQDLNRHVLTLQDARCDDHGDREFVAGPSPAHARRARDASTRSPSCRPRC